MGGGFPNSVCGCTAPTSSTTSSVAMGAQYVTVSVR
jgi:hypothetical protein